MKNDLTSEEWYELYLLVREIPDKQIVSEKALNAVEKVEKIAKELKGR